MDLAMVKVEKLISQVPCLKFVVKLISIENPYITTIKSFITVCPG
jgi:hypothetical protein